jgi:hypothetical protein
LKDSAGTDVLRAVTALMQNKSFFSPAVSRVMLDDYVRQLGERGITDRAKRCRSANASVSADCRRASEQGDCRNSPFEPDTVETHRARIMEKLDAQRGRNRALRRSQRHRFDGYQPL